MLVESNPPQEIEVGEHLACSHHHRRERVVRDRDREARLLAEALVEVLEKRASAGEHDAAVDDVRRELGRRLLERGPDRLDDRRPRSRRAPRGSPRRETTIVFGTPSTRSRPLISSVSSSSSGNAEPSFILTSSAVRSPMRRLYLRLMYWMIASSISLPGHADGAGVDDAGHRDDRDVRRSAADVEDHVARGLRDRKPRADRRHHRLLDQIDLGRFRRASRNRARRASRPG